MPTEGGETVLYVGTPLADATEAAATLASVADSIETEAVDSIDDAVEYLSDDAVDCIVSEPVLSDGVYRELLERTLAVDPPVPFVLVADGGSESLAVAAFRAGVTDYVSMAEEDVEALAERLERALESDAVPVDGGQRAAVEGSSSALSALLEHLPVGVLVEDASRTVLATNEAFTRLFDIDVDPEEFVGRDCDDAALAVADQFEHPDEFVAEIRQTLARRTPVRATTLDRRDGRTFERDYVPYDGPNGEANLWLYRDVTERVERERLLSEREDALERENERLDAFASTLSHDVRGPLAVARGQLELARDECDSDHLVTVGDALDRIDTLVDDVLSLAREGGRVDSVESVSLPNCARAAWTHVETGGATLDIETDDTVAADRSRLERLFENLFRNSVEHGSTGDRAESGDSAEHAEPFVTVRVGALDDGFYVEDDGVGIPPEEREAVFEEGYTSGTDGTGFGLAIVDRIAEAHGWTVTVTEGPDGGARFEVRGVSTDPDA